MPQTDGATGGRESAWTVAEVARMNAVDRRQAEILRAYLRDITDDDTPARPAGCAPAGRAPEPDRG